MLWEKWNEIRGWEVFLNRLVREDFFKETLFKLRIKLEKWVSDIKREENSILGVMGIVC